MSSFSVVPPVENPPTTPTVRLPAELLDLVCEAVLSQTDATARGVVAGQLIQEIYHSLAWLHPDPSHPERASFQLVVDEADAHQARLQGTPEATPIAYDGLRVADPEPQGEVRPERHSNLCDRLVYTNRPCTCPRGDRPGTLQELDGEVGRTPAAAKRSHKAPAHTPGRG